jgi:hypothetical protein
MPKENQLSLGEEDYDDDMPRVRLIFCGLCVALAPDAKDGEWLGRRAGIAVSDPDKDGYVECLAKMSDKSGRRLPLRLLKALEQYYAKDFGGDDCV